MTNDYRQTVGGSEFIPDKMPLVEPTVPTLSAPTVLIFQGLSKPPPPPLVITNKPLNSPAGTEQNSTALQTYYRIPITNNRIL